MFKEQACTEFSTNDMFDEVPRPSVAQLIPRERNQLIGEFR